MAAEILLRPATLDDLPRVVEIYNEGIAGRLATFETVPRNMADLAGWASDRQPFVVAETDARLVGWARAAAYSDRCVYSGVGEHAVYVDGAARGQGVGRALLDALAEQSERAGLYKLTSRIFVVNAASRAAHLAAGFTEVGVQRRHGKLDGEWMDCVLVERLLGEAID